MPQEITEQVVSSPKASIGKNEHQMTQRIIDGTISFLATVLGFALSWPFWRDFSYWGESRTAWWIYFIVGFLMAFYVFYLFLGNMRTLFLHDALEKSGFFKKDKSPTEPKEEIQ